MTKNDDLFYVKGSLVAVEGILTISSGFCGFLWVFSGVLIGIMALFLFFGLDIDTLDNF
jgi:hypothetical protein